MTGRCAMAIDGRDGRGTLRHGSALRGALRALLAVLRVAALTGPRARRCGRASG